MPFDVLMDAKMEVLGKLLLSRGKETGQPRNLFSLLFLQFVGWQKCRIPGQSQLLVQPPQFVFHDPAAPLVTIPHLVCYRVV